MPKLSIEIKLNGFDELLEKIKSSDVSINSTAKKCIDKSASIMESELKTQMKKSGVPNNLINAMPKSEVIVEGDRFVARVGYIKGAYNPNNLSDGYKVLFLNYGTPNRSKHGKVSARGFIQKAKRKAKTSIRKQQNQTLNDIIQELK